MKNGKAANNKSGKGGKNNKKELQQEEQQPIGDPKRITRILKGFHLDTGEDYEYNVYEEDKGLTDEQIRKKKRLEHSRNVIEPAWKEVLNTSSTEKNEIPRGSSSKKKNSSSAEIDDSIGPILRSNSKDANSSRLEVSKGVENIDQAFMLPRDERLKLWKRPSTISNISSTPVGSNSNPLHHVQVNIPANEEEEEIVDYDPMTEEEENVEPTYAKKEHVVHMFDFLVHDIPLPDNMRKCSDADLLRFFCHGDNEYNPKSRETIKSDEAIKKALSAMTARGFHPKNGMLLHVGLPICFFPRKTDTDEEMLEKLFLSHYMLLLRENKNLHEQMLQVAEVTDPDDIWNLIKLVYANLETFSPPGLHTTLDEKWKEAMNMLRENDANDVLPPKGVTVPMYQGGRLGSLPMEARAAVEQRDKLRSPSYERPAEDSAAILRSYSNRADGQDVSASGQKLPQGNKHAYDDESYDHDAHERARKNFHASNGVQIINTRNMDHVTMSSSLESAKIQALINYASSEIAAGRPINFANHFIGESRKLLTNMLVIKKKLQVYQLTDDSWWDKVSAKELLGWLKQIYPANAMHADIKPHVLITEALNKVGHSMYCNMINLQKVRDTIQTPLETMLKDFKEPGDDYIDDIYQLFLRKLKAIRGSGDANVPHVMKFIQNEVDNLADLKIRLQFQHIVLFVGMAIQDYLDTLAPLADKWGILPMQLESYLLERIKHPRMSMILPGIVSLEDNQIIKNIILLISVMHPLIRRMRKGEILAKGVAV